MSCKWCAESMPPNRKDGFCSDICMDHWNNTHKPEPYLILHKVRGEPAFDIAQLIGDDSDGPLWIIPTSGHRAHPAEAWSLNTLHQHAYNQVIPITSKSTNDKQWVTLPDHYTINAQPKAILTNVSSLLASIGLSAPIKKRKA